MKNQDAKFLNGIIFKLPHQNAPDFVKGQLSIKREELIESLQNESGDWINLQLKVSKEGKPYAQIDEWKPNSDQSEGSKAQKSPKEDDDLPF
jgi:hypothetical protein